MGLDYVHKRTTSPKEGSISAFKPVMPALGSFVGSTFKVFKPLLVAFPGVPLYLLFGGGIRRGCGQISPSPDQVSHIKEFIKRLGVSTRISQARRTEFVKRRAFLCLVFPGIASSLRCDGTELRPRR